MEINKTLKRLGLPLGQYVVFGSGPMAAYGIRDSDDIDLLVTADLYQNLKAEGWGIKHWPDGVEYLAQDNVEVADSWNYGSYHPSADDIITQAVMMNGIPYAPLTEVLAWKKAFGRPKDLIDVQLIEDYLRSHPSKALADGTHEWVLSFLRQDGHNHKLANKLERHGVHHIGPVSFPLEGLNHIIGPDETYAFYEAPEQLDERVNRLVDSIQRGWEPPPLIVTNFWEDDFTIADGGHRQRALLKSGRAEHGVIFYFKDEASMNEFKAKHG
jgi:hypothetical protein